MEETSQYGYCDKESWDEWGSHSSTSHQEEVAGARPSEEPPRSTAYYYADLERIKRQNGGQDKQNGVPDGPTKLDNELSEYVESNEVINDGAVKDVPPLRDRPSPEYTSPEHTSPERGPGRGETYSTAGTFPMPEPREKEPLLAELEIVGRVPLTQLDSAPGVSRSRSWYLCCPNIGDEEISRESSWRYSSLRPVTAPPIPGHSGAHAGARGGEEACALRAERDGLARALGAERARAAAAARAHDARLAELHGVIAELVRRRAADQRARAIPEEDGSDDCESVTQPAGELDPDADLSHSDPNDNSSLLSPSELPTPRDPKPDPLPDDTDTSITDHLRFDKPPAEASPPQGSERRSSLRLSERGSDVCVSTARCCQTPRAACSGCERDRLSPGLLPPSPGRCESREAKIASRVRLRKTADTSSDLNVDEAWCVEAAERLALDVCAQADLREALAAAGEGEGTGAVWRARCARLAADCRVLDCALARALDTAQRLSRACAVHESSTVALCGALRAADRALETYDVLLALAETRAAPPAPHRADDAQRAAAESVARRLLARLEAAPAWGEPLLSPGPWHNHHQSGEPDEELPPWGAGSEERLREHAARLKRDTVALRALRPPPQLYSPHDAEEDDAPSADGVSVAEMEAAVLMQEVLVARETRAAERAAALVREKKQGEAGRRRRRHWLEPRASETDL